MEEDTVSWGWRDDLVVKSTCCSGERLELGPLTNMVDPGSVTPIVRDEMPHF